MILFSRSCGVSFFSAGVCFEDPPKEVPAFESFASAEEVLQIQKVKDETDATKINLIYAIMTIPH